ncbi:unnamed protein product [Nesidiocoris tenuis]|uniref:Uncharacterized protein n=1 Tax=Nesidiocoris tenuis TaxID=355587 RepID=A0A6H5GWM4_9HEMI|nr:unnamed protein product [Nesidiocoris tenuis]
MLDVFRNLLLSIKTRYQDDEGADIPVGKDDDRAPRIIPEPVQLNHSPLLANKDSSQRKVAFSGDGANDWIRQTRMKHNMLLYYSTYRQHEKNVNSQSFRTADRNPTNHNIIHPGTLALNFIRDIIFIDRHTENCLKGYLGKKPSFSKKPSAQTSSSLFRVITMTVELRWESVLQEALHSVRSLLCTATNESPHERMFRHPRRTSNGESLPSWLLYPGKVLMKRQVRSSKYDPLVDEVDLLEADRNHALVRLQNGREVSVSLKHLAPRGDICIGDNVEEDFQDVPPLRQSDTLLQKRIPEEEEKEENEGEHEADDKHENRTLPRKMITTTKWKYIHRLTRHEGIVRSSYPSMLSSGNLLANDTSDRKPATWALYLLKLLSADATFSAPARARSAASPTFQPASSRYFAPVKCALRFKCESRSAFIPENIRAHRQPRGRAHGLHV